MVDLEKAIRQIEESVDTLNCILEYEDDGLDDFTAVTIESSIDKLENIIMNLDAL